MLGLSASAVRTMVAVLQALFGACRAEEPPACCSCKEEPEVLTKAWIDSLEQVSVLKEAATSETAACSRHSPGRHWGPASPKQQADCPRPSGAVAAHGGLGMLAVPREFDGARSGMLRAAAVPGLATSREDDASRGEKDSSSEALAAAEEQRRCLQASLRAFTRSLLRGVSVNVLLDDGRTRLAEARLDSELTHLVLHVPNAQHPVALRSIESVCAPEEAWLPRVGGEVPEGQQPLDDCCATLIIQGGQFLTFVFDAPRTREYFEMCLKVLILAKESSKPATGREEAAGRLAMVPPRPGDAGPAPSEELSPQAFVPGLATAPPLAPRGQLHPVLEVDEAAEAQSPASVQSVAGEAATHGDSD